MSKERTVKSRKGTQISFYAPELVEPLKEASAKTGIPQAIIARIAIREKVSKIFEKIERGEEVTVTI